MDRNFKEYQYEEHNWKYLFGPVVSFSLFLIGLPLTYFLHHSIGMLVAGFIMGSIVLGFLFIPCLVLFFQYQRNDKNKTVRIYNNKDIEINSTLIELNEIEFIEIHRYQFGTFSTTPWKDFNFWTIGTTSGQMHITTCLSVESKIIEQTYSGLTRTKKSHFQSIPKNRITSANIP